MVEVKKRILWLDALKGYAILLVMLSHILPYNDVLGIFYSGYMPLFFISSGYTDKGNLSQICIIKKAKRLLIPYFFYGIVCTLIFSFFLNSDRYQGGTIREWCGLIYARFCLFPYGLPNNMYFLPIESTSALWFLPALFLGFVFYYIMKNLEMRGVSFWFLYGGAIILTMAMSQLPVLLPWSFDISLLISFFMFLGTKLKLCLNSYHLERMGLSALCFFILFFGLAYLNGGINMSVRQFGDRGLFSILMLVVIGVVYFISLFALFQVLTHKIVEVFAWLGRLSLRLMCIQMPVFFVLAKILSRYDVNSIIWISLVKLIVVIIVAQILDMVYSKLNASMKIIKYL